MEYKDQIKEHFEHIGSEYDYWKKRNSYYYQQIKAFYRSHIPAGSRVAEFGCATGDVLAACEPKKGLGIDISPGFIEIARSKYPQYEFKAADAENFSLEEKFDYVVMSDLIDHLSDIPAAIESAFNLLEENGRLIITTINPLWTPAFELLEKLHLKMPEGPHCFIPNSSLEFYCRIKGFRPVSKGALVAIPLKIFFISGLINKIFPRLPL